MKVLVTGGGGFLGAWITRLLKASGHEVRIFDIAPRKPSFDRIVNAASPPEWITGDITDLRVVNDAANGCDAVAHLAGLLTPECKADPVRGAMVNVIGTLNVFESCRRHGIERIVYTSSAAVFDPAESAAARPHSQYGAFKLACESSARAYFVDHGFGSIGFRPFVVYGPGRETGLTAGPTLACRAAARNEPYTIPYSGSAGLIYVTDVAAAYNAALAAPSRGAEVFNLGGIIASNEEVVSEIKRQVPGAQLRIDGPVASFVPDPTQDLPDRTFPNLPKTSLRDGIAATIAFYREARP
jgi:nucleoside-diphosphate-sugar epimerase